MADETKEEQSPPKKKSKLFKILFLIIFLLVVGAAAAFFLKGPGFKKVTGMSSQVLRMKIPAPTTSPKPSGNPLKKATIKPASKGSLSKAAAPQNTATPAKITEPGKDKNQIKIAARQNTTKPADVDVSSEVMKQANVQAEAKASTIPINSSGPRGEMDYRIYVSVNRLSGYEVHLRDFSIQDEYRIHQVSALVRIDPALIQKPDSN